MSHSAKKFTIRILILLFICSSASTAQSDNPKKVSIPNIDPERLELKIDSLVNNYRQKLSSAGVSLAVVKGDSISFQKAYGYRDESLTIPIDVESTVFYTASVSKLIIATATMKLVDQGKLKLDDPVSKYLPDLKIKNPFDVPLKVVHLLNHTSGIDEHTLGIDAPLNSRNVPLSEYLESYPPKIVIEPGSQINYSNQGIALAGHLVEQISGQLFEEFAQEHLFRPAGMASSSFVQPPPDPLRQQMAYERFPKSKLIYSVGSMVTTAPDMARFIMSNFSGSSHQILKDGTLATMHNRTHSPRPEMPGVAIGFFESVINGRKGLFHTGARDHRSILVMLPEHKIGIYAVMSGDPNAPLRYDIVNTILGEIFPEDEKVAIETAWDNEDLEGFTGYYRLNSMPTNTIEKVRGLIGDLPISLREGSLYLGNPGGASSTKLTRVKELLFRTESGGFVAFEKVDDQITQMFVSTPLRDSVSCTKIHPLESGKLHLIIAIVCFLTFLTFSIIHFVKFLIKVIKRKPRPEQGKLSSWAWKLNRISSGLFVLAVILGLVLVITTENKHNYSAMRILYPVSTTLLLAALASMATIVIAYWVWKRGLWTLSKRILYSVLAGLYGWMLSFMWYWHVIGYQF